MRHTVSHFNNFSKNNLSHKDFFNKNLHFLQKNDILPTVCFLKNNYFHKNSLDEFTHNSRPSNNTSRKHAQFPTDAYVIVSYHTRFRSRKRSLDNVISRFTNERENGRTQDEGNRDEARPRASIFPRKSSTGGFLNGDAEYAARILGSRTTSRVGFSRAPANS